MYTLYGGRFTRGLVVEMVMAEGDIEYELRNVDILNGEHRQPEFLRLNPAGYVPVLVKPDGQVLYETPAINLYLADQHRLTELAPSIDDADRGPFLSNLFFLSNDLEPTLKRWLYPNRYVLRVEDEPQMRELALQQALERMGVIERKLQQHGPYHLGQRFSLVDIIVSYWAEYIDFEHQLDPYPALRHCKELVSNRPKLRPFFDELMKSLVEYKQVLSAVDGVK